MMAGKINQPVRKPVLFFLQLLGCICLYLSGLTRIYAVEWGYYPGIRAEQTYLQKQRRQQIQVQSPGVGLQAEKTTGWILDPEITVDETVTDNLRLAPDGFENSDMVTTVTPGLRIRRQSRRLDFGLFYNLQNLYYKNNSELNDRFHLLDVNGTGELLEDHLFLDISVNNSQQNVSRAGGLALDNISASGDRSNVLTYNVNPYWIQRVGDFMDVEARYSFNEVKSSDTFNSESENILITAISGENFNRLNWEVTYDDETIDNEGGISTEFRTIFAELEYLLTRKFALKGSVGYDDNEFTTSGGEISGERWNLGAVWRPSTRTSLEATAGRRFFGTDLFLEASHRSRRTQWRFTFSQVPDTTRTTLFEQQVFTSTDIFGQPIDPVTGQPAQLSVTNPAQTVEVLIRERFNGAVNYTLRKNIFNLSVFHETRDFQVSRSEETSQGANASWIWQVGPRTTSSLRFTWNDSDFRAGGSTEYYITEYILTRILGKKLEANVGFRHVETVSDTPTNEYTENRIYASIYKFF